MDAGPLRLRGHPRAFIPVLRAVELMVASDVDDRLGLERWLLGRPRRGFPPWRMNVTGQDHHVGLQVRRWSEAGELQVEVGIDGDLHRQRGADAPSHSRLDMLLIVSKS